MARLSRYALAGLPQHVVHRGVDRVAIVREDSDRLFLHACLAEAADRHGCAVHAYCLMSNHFHLLLTPETADGIARMLQSVGRRYVRYFNTVHGRTGTLWEGRYRAAPVESERYLLACMRYIELNPVRAGLVAAPGLWRWSSHRHHAQGTADRLVTDHPLFLTLGRHRKERAAAWLALFDAPLPPDTAETIRTATRRGWPLGDETFRARLAAASGRPAAPRRRGRPPKRETAEAEEIGL